MLLLARVKLMRGDLRGGLQALLAAEAANPRAPGIYTQLGDAYARLLQWENAKVAYEKALALDEDNALAFQGLSSVYRRLGDNQQTVDTALRAVSLLHRLPLAHFNLGVAMARSGENERAVVALETALRFQPEMVNAHRYLAIIHKSNGGDPEKAQFHHSEVFRITHDRRRRTKRADTHREKLFDLPPIPHRKERLATLLRERPDPKPVDETKSGKTFVLVSGLPRSGTSLMMQLLEAGGMPVMTDHKRAADVDNPAAIMNGKQSNRSAKSRSYLTTKQSPAGRSNAFRCSCRECRCNIGTGSFYEPAHRRGYRLATADGAKAEGQGNQT